MTNMIKLYKIRIGEKVYEVEVEEVTEKDGNIETSADSKGKQKIDKNENPPLQGETGTNESSNAGTYCGCKSKSWRKGESWR